MDTDSQVMNACRKIVKTIWHMGLRPQERLPSQKKLVTVTGFCNNTITPATQLLADAGFLKNTHKIGRVLLDRNKWPDQLWRIAIPYGLPDDRPGCQFPAVFLCFLQSRLQSLGCKCICLPRLPQYSGEEIHELNHFAGLEQLVEEERLDGILTSAHFSPNVIGKCMERNLPFCLIGEDPIVPFRIEFDTVHLIDCAMKRFHEQGIRRPLLLESNDTIPLNSRSTASHHFLQLAEQYGMETNVDSVFIGSVVSLLERIPHFTSELKYDGVLVLNDIVGSACSISFALAGRCPRMAVQTNRQIALSYALPLIQYEYDVDVLASRAVNLILDTILTKVQHSVVTHTFQEKGGEQY